jgi:AmmeMemoRadiSam system protein B
MKVRPAAVAGSWYPGNPSALRHDLDEYLEAAGTPPAGRVQAIVVPHAGLMFSGPVGAYAYKAAARGSYDVAVLVGPSHFVPFQGVALWPEGAFETPLGAARIDAAGAGAIAEAAVVHAMPSAHAREHSLEMQLPFLRHLLPDVPIVPLLMGFQTRETIVALASGLAHAFRGRRALLVASSDLSHYFDAETAGRLDGEVRACVAAFDPDRLFARFESFPEHERGQYVACGGGPMLAVMLAARELGATAARVLKYAHSGEISGDYAGVVGYLAAAIGAFDAPGTADTRAH